jgi:hypothetical protein
MGREGIDDRLGTEEKKGKEGRKNRLEEEEKKSIV